MAKVSRTHRCKTEMFFQQGKANRFWVVRVCNAGLFPRSRPLFSEKSENLTLDRGGLSRVLSFKG